MASLPFPTTSSTSPPSNPPKLPKTNRQKTQLKPHQALSKSYFHSISSLSKHGQTQQCFELLHEMSLKNLIIGPAVYVEILQGCVYERDLPLGQQIHALVIKRGELYAKNEYIETKLLVFYTKCGPLDVAEGFFRKLRVKNVFSWAAIIGLRVTVGLYEEALMGACEMLGSGFVADNFVVPNVLKASGALRWVRFGRGVHGYVVKMGFGGCVFVCSSLVDMYGKCGVLDDSRKVFKEMPERNVVSWNSMIGGCVRNGFNEEAIGMFRHMRLDGVEPTRVTLSSFLSACANLGAIEEGKQGHAIAFVGGFELDNILGSSILNFYSKVGLVEDAELVFNSLSEKDVVTWNLLISCYVQCEQVEKALSTCHLMRLENKRFDSVTLASILSVCASQRNLELGKEGHCYCIRNNLESDVGVASGIVDMYAKCGKMGDAGRVFDSTTNKDLILWNSLLTAYAELGLTGESMKLFYRMQLESVPLNAISWNAVILGFPKKGQAHEAEGMFSQMQSIGVHNSMTCTSHSSGLLQNDLGNAACTMCRKFYDLR